MIKNKILLIVCLTSCLYNPVLGMVITPTRIAYVEVEKVFNNLDRVREAREALQELIEDKKEEVEDTERAIEGVAGKIEEQKDSLPEEELKGLEDSLDERREGLRELKIVSQELITDQEKTLRHNIMGQIYDTIEKMADKNDYTIILNKDMILFSVEEQVDLTDKVIKNMNQVND